MPRDTVREVSSVTTNILHPNLVQPVVPRPDILSLTGLIEGEIKSKWDSQGGRLGSSKVPGREGLIKAGEGYYREYANGRIYWSPSTGAHEVHGAILNKWSSLGFDRGFLGYPVTDELITPDGVGRYNHFQGGSIYWTPQTGAHEIHGAIRERWVDLGWERSYLGYPIGDEVDFAEGGRASEFQNGGIYWWPDTGAIDLKDVVVHYTGMYCFGETDWDQGSTADEPYAIVSVATPQVARSYTSQVYTDVDSGDSRPDIIEIYRGRPYGINLGAVVMESDFGDPNKYKDEVQKAVMGVHAVGTLALGLIPAVGPIIASIAGPALGSHMPSIGGAINDLFDWGDDRIGGSNLTVSAKQMVLLAARTGNTNFWGIGYKLETGLISGLGASYKVYFGIVPA